MDVLLNVNSSQVGFVIQLMILLPLHGMKQVVFQFAAMVKMFWERSAMTGTLMELDANLIVRVRVPAIFVREGLK